MNIPKDLLYTKSHEWVKLEGATAKMGLTDFAQDALGDLVFINLPEIGDSVTAGERFGDVESVKAVSDVYSPVTGTVSDINMDVIDAPEMINRSPYDAWLIEVEDVTAKAQLMDPAAYEAFCAAQEH